MDTSLSKVKAHALILFHVYLFQNNISFNANSISSVIGEHLNFGK